MGLELVAEARLLAEAGETRGAERLLREALLGDDADAIIVAAIELGRLYERRGEVAEAMAWRRLAVRFGE